MWHWSPAGSSKCIIAIKHVHWAQLHISDIFWKGSFCIKFLPTTTKKILNVCILCLSMWIPETLQYGPECLLYRQADCKGLLNYSPTVVQLTIEVFRRFKREREVTGDSPLGGTGCRHGLKMSSFVIGNALQCLEIRFSRLPAHSPSCWAQVTLPVSLLTLITVTFNWITTSSIQSAFQQLTPCPIKTPRSFKNYKAMLKFLSGGSTSS